MKILAVGGGSGGHVTPVVAVVNELYQTDRDLTVRFVCDKAFESQSRGIMSHADVPVQVSTIMAGKFRRYSHMTRMQHMTSIDIMFRNFTDLFKVMIGFMQSALLIMRFKPDVVFAKGGYVSLPMGLAARVLGYPLVIHDSDTRPGLTNRILARYATVIATGSPLENYPYDRRKSHYIGVPIAREFSPVTAEEQRSYKRAIGINPDSFLVVATGGGLGAPNINQALVAAAPALLKRGLSVYHVTGKKHYEIVRPQVAGMANYVAVPFVYEKMYQVLGAADVVISRASATFLQELAGLAKPVIAVPARQLGDQQKNAAVYRQADAAIVMSDDEISDGKKLEAAILELVDNSSEASRLSANLHGFARPNAAHDLAHLVSDAAKKH